MFATGRQLGCAWVVCTAEEQDPPRLTFVLLFYAGSRIERASCMRWNFGSLRKAIIAAKDDPKGWSKKRITSILSRMHRSKTLRPYTQARRSHMALVSAAEAYFGSWGKALYAAGIDPKLYFVHQRWRKPSVKRSRKVEFLRLSKSFQQLEFRG